MMIATIGIVGHTVPGNHYGIVSGELAEPLGRIVDRTLASTGGGSW